MFLIDDILNYHEYNDNMLYGLYDPYSKRFVYTHSNKHILAHTAFLFSSRYELWLCNIAVAENFEPNIIDNDVAQNWSIDFNGQQLTSNGLFASRSIIDVPLLKDVGQANITTAPLADTEYIKYVVDLFTRISQKVVRPWHDDYFHESDFVYHDIIQSPFTSKRREFYTQVLRVVYFEADFNTARNKIEEMNNAYYSIL
jgi:hypothetical protein